MALPTFSAQELVAMRLLLFMTNPAAFDPSTHLVSAMFEGLHEKGFSRMAHLTWGSSERALMGIIFPMTGQAVTGVGEPEAEDPLPLLLGHMAAIAGSHPVSPRQIETALQVV